MKHFLYHFKTVSAEEKEILIAVLSDMGFNGFEEQENDLLSYISEEDEMKLDKNVIHEFGFEFSVHPVNQTNWNEEWEKSFQPVPIVKEGADVPWVYLYANFHQPHPKAQYNICITPKMSFGTGHHETTQLMMEAMDHISFENKRVVDFGAGTGVLAIFAYMLGSRDLVAIDYDRWCIENAEENFEVNGCKNIELVQADKYGEYSADVILANINLNIILDNLHTMWNALKAGGTLLMSGMLLQDEPIISQEIKTLTNHNITVTHKGNWICVRIDK